MSPCKREWVNVKCARHLYDHPIVQSERHDIENISLHSCFSPLVDSGDNGSLPSPGSELAMRVDNDDIELVLFGLW
jgi:hypothetical protein